MSHFTYKAKKSSGEIYSADHDAEDRYELYRMIRESGDELVSLQEKKTSRGLHLNISFTALSKHVKPIERINFARNLGSMLEAGLALSRALSVLERQTHDASLKAIIIELENDVNRGATFADALTKHPKVFPSIFVSMVHAGEQSGTLAESLKVIAVQLDSTHNLERRIRGALMYPAVIVTAMIIIAILMFIFVIPTLLKTFTELKVQLPFTTQIILNLSNLIQHDGLFVALGVIIVAGAFWWWSRRLAGKKLFHMLILHLPVIGSLVQEVNTARTSRTLSSLLGAGVDVVEAVMITKNVVQNVHFRSVLDKAAVAIKKGDPMSKVFNEYGKLYPVFFSEMLSVGEETGKTGEMLLGVARYYEEDIDQRTKDMSTIIEPFLMIVIGAAVGFFAISMIQPMYALVNAI